MIRMSYLGFLVLNDARSDDAWSYGEARSAHGTFSWVTYQNPISLTVSFGRQGRLESAVQESPSRNESATRARHWGRCRSCP
jgi:hypothetical protein